MKLTTKARYAVMAMVDLAADGREGPTPLAAIAERQEISQAYLEQLFARLRRAGLVNSVRGPGGGYRLARAPSTIVVREIVEAVSPPIRVTRCGESGPATCLKDSRCGTHDLWQALGDHINLFLGTVSLADVVEGRLAPPGPCALRPRAGMRQHDPADLTL